MTDVDRHELERSSDPYQSQLGFLLMKWENRKLTSTIKQ